MNLMESFYKLPQSLAECSGFISKTTGDPVDLTWSAKAVYTYMLSRNEFFTEKLKGTHYEAQETIADKCNMDYRTVGNFLRMFMKHGVIKGNKVKPSVGQWRWNYHDVDEYLDLYNWKYKVDEEGKQVKDGYLIMGQNPAKEDIAPNFKGEPEPDYSEYFVSCDEKDNEDSLSYKGFENSTKQNYYQDIDEPF